jgi:hypothetical protein
MFVLVGCHKLTNDGTNAGTSHTAYFQMWNILINLQIEHFQISAELLPFLLDI